MCSSQFLMALAIVSASVGQAPAADEAKTQNQIFQRWWGNELNWKYEELPDKGAVPTFRVPYSGHIWPDTAGGVVQPLRKYDYAFHRGRSLATSHELWDAQSGRETSYVTQRYGLFGGRVVSVPVSRVPYWHGHCNGWAAAAIRHPEPQRSVTRNGVTFTPADIKGLLAEVYVYSQYETLAGEYTMVEPDLLHVLITNWIGRQQYPIAMEAVPGTERWNYPIYAYATSSARRSDREVEVKMNIAYSYYSNGESDRSEHLKRTMLFHYTLNLDDQGRIVGGRYFWDSSRIDLLWAPLPVIQGARDGNERGNPHIDVAEIMSIARESVPEELLAKWTNGNYSAWIAEAVASTDEAPPEEATAVAE